jgi:hypothetical protein
MTAWTEFDFLDEVDLERYELTGRLGSGADYDVRAALDRETGQQVALKRPVPQAVSRKQHYNIEERTGRMIEAHQQVAGKTGVLAPILGYTGRAVHDRFFGDDLAEEYTVIVQARAAGIPLLGDMMSRITGVPIGVGQNLFAVFPLVQDPAVPAFPVHNQILDLQEVYLEAGYVLLDMRPQNIFYQPAAGRITVIDTGALAGPDSEPPRGRPPFDVNDACLEMIKFYTTPEEPPPQANGYRDARNLRPIVSWREETDGLDRQLAAASGAVEEAGRVVLEKIGVRAYTGYNEFRDDLNAYLNAVLERDRALPGFPEAREAWTGALAWLREDYWARFLFDAETELAGYAI